MHEWLAAQAAAGYLADPAGPVYLPGSGLSFRGPDGIALELFAPPA